MKTSIFIPIILIFMALGCKNKPENTLQEITPAVATNQETPKKASVDITPIEHASMILDFYGQTIYVDPVGKPTLYDGRPPADLVLVTDIHSDHLDTLALSHIVTENTKIIAPNAVEAKLPVSMKEKTIVMNNGETTNVNGIAIKAIPMYNLREAAAEFHPKGRGNGYVLSAGETNIYIAGDTEGIPEMRRLKHIDIAFIPMNLPYTMPVSAAADAVLEFKPKKVYPYHYRGANGMSDVAQFKNIIETNDPSIKVIQLDWYPEL